jgi:glucose/arabinose dehydrogenase
MSADWRLAWAAVSCLAAALCTSCRTDRHGAGSDAVAPPLQDGDVAPPRGAFCSLPGSVVWTAQGPRTVPGESAAAPDIGWLKLPVGFCAHRFATVKMARQLRFAPDGDLFVASPTTRTTGGANDGVAGVVLLADDDHDGVADANLTFLTGLPSVQGLTFANGYLYYQDGSTIRRVAVADGDRQPSGPSQTVTTMDAWPQDGLHWAKVIDVSQDGTMYISNGSNQTEACSSSRPVFGAIVGLNPDGSTSVVARGFRNPIALRCEKTHDVCLVAELALDYSGSDNGREKLLVVHDGDDWGYPCCASQDLPYRGVVAEDTRAVPDCSRVAAESASFLIGHTPFGIDFESGLWPAPWTGRVFVTLHGDFGTWEGARVVAIALDPTTGTPLPATEVGGAAPSGNMLDFATGWDDGRNDHGRPAPIAFSADGRMFLGDDQLGAIVWVAPVDLMPP